jgi:hypothetical protein
MASAPDVIYPPIAGQILFLALMDLPFSKIRSAGKTSAWMGGRSAINPRRIFELILNAGESEAETRAGQSVDGDRGQNADGKRRNFAVQAARRS